MSKFAKLFGLLILFAITGLVSWVAQKQNSSNTISPFVSAKYSDVKNVRLVSGILVPKKEITLKSKISGIIEEIYVTSGQKVQKGDAVARIKLLADPRNVEISERQLKLAEINLNESETKYRGSLITQLS